MIAATGRTGPRYYSFFQVYLLANVLLVAGATILVVNIIGIKGFARIPYVNGLIYALSGAIGVGYALFHARVLRWEKLSWPLIIWITALACSTVTGIVTQNSIQYIISWGVYCLIGMLMFCVAAADRQGPLSENSANLIDSNTFMAICSALAVLSMFSENKLIQFPLALSIGIYALSVRKNHLTVALGLIIIVAIHINLSRGLALDMSRGGLITLAMALILYSVFRRNFFSLALSLVSILFLYVAAVSVDREVLQFLPRRLEEGALLLRGDSMREHAATFQRFYETKMVAEDFQRAGPLEWAFGKGLGRTIDMSASVDASVGRNALMGMQAVNNVHFLPVAVFHKFGIVGLIFLTTVVLWIMRAFIVDTYRRDNNKLIFFCYLYIFSALAYALAASNYLIANPLWPMMIGVLISLREIRAASRRSIQRPTSPPPQRLPVEHTPEWRDAR